MLGFELPGYEFSLSTTGTNGVDFGTTTASNPHRIEIPDCFLSVA